MGTEAFEAAYAAGRTIDLARVLTLATDMAVDGEAAPVAPPDPLA